MEFRRRQQLPRRPLASVVGEYDNEASSSASASSSSLAAKAIRASSAHMDSSLSSAYATTPLSPSLSEDFSSSNHASVKCSTERKHGFWGALARKAKSIIEDNNMPHLPETPLEVRAQMPVSNVGHKQQHHCVHQSRQSSQRSESPALQKGLDAIASSLSYIGGTIGSAVEEGLTIVENRAAEIIHETRKNIKKNPGKFQENDPTFGHHPAVQQSQTESEMQTQEEIQLKASRDVAMAMAAKAKLLLRELKTVKADLAFAKERCIQLEEENKMLRDSHGRGDGPEDDDLIRLQLETLLAEKARLAHENSVYARENRFLREVVEYHQLTMQDVVYMDEASEEVNEVYPTSKVPLLLNRPASAALSAATLPSSSIYPVPPPSMR